MFWVEKVQLKNKLERFGSVGDTGNSKGVKITCAQESPPA